jgi:hypothetical protein
MEHTRLRKLWFGQSKASAIRCRGSSNGMSIPPPDPDAPDAFRLPDGYKVSASARARGVAAFFEQA